VHESEEIEVGALADEIATTLRAGKRFKISCFGNFSARRLKKRRLLLEPETAVADADLVQKLVVYVEWSQVLKQALNPAR